MRSGGFGGVRKCLNWLQETKTLAFSSCKDFGIVINFSNIFECHKMINVQLLGLRIVEANCRGADGSTCNDDNGTRDNEFGTGDWVP